MKLLKYFLLLIVIVLLGGAAYVALIDGKFTIHENLQLKAPRDLVFQEINNLKNWETWSDFRNDGVQTTYSETTSDSGAFFTWKNDELNSSGKIINTEVERSSLIRQEANFQKGIGETAYNSTWNLNKEGDTTFVRLEINGKLDFRAKAFQLFKGDSAQKNLNIRVQKNLESLKATILQKMQVYSINMDGVKTTDSRTYIYTSQSLKNTPEIIAENRLEQTEKLLYFIESWHPQAPKGPAFMIYNTIDREHHNVIVSFAVPIQIDKDIEIEDSEQNILTGTQPSQRVIKGTLKGDYQNIPKLWEAVKTYLVANQLEQDNQAKPFEVYKITKKDSENPADWITELYVPIKENPQHSNLSENWGL